MQPLQKLDETKATLRVLLYLYDKKEAKLTDIIQNIPNTGQKAIYTTLKTLKQLNLIQEKTSQNFPFTRKITLTQKGQKTAEKIKQIKTILES
ncbi:MAG: winged helix-turn-helix transcriptional regulator [Candidatus Bathyarchaeia archaeon]